ncbi:Rootletin [Merluccius polli]|uniref:Rootletin n=1 Tax=Merluccius polli TaxID=89951 RepID=A0AA47NUJ9_MERPO|nr:Rootletin [Merluccius polli]
MRLHVCVSPSERSVEQLEEKQSELRREVVGLKEVLSQVTLQKEVLEEEKTSLSLALNKVEVLKAEQEVHLNRLQNQEAALRDSLAKMAALSEGLASDKVELNRLLLQGEGEKAELCERRREAESERTASRGEGARLQQQLGDLGAKKRSLEASQHLLQEARERLEEEVCLLQRENARLLEQHAQVGYVVKLKHDPLHEIDHTLYSITADWTLHSKCLETRYVPDNHTADTLAENLKAALADWGLDENKLACITTDNGANIVAAIRNLGWPWLNCFGHNLHLAVSHGLDSDKDRTARVIGLCRSLVNIFHMSWIKKRDMRKAQAEANLPQHCLVLDVATRWGTKQKMVERVLEQLPAIRHVLVEDRKHGHLNPTWQDVSVLESINAAMKPLADFTDVLSGKNTSQCPQLSLYWN